jgi:hypothetical protein
MGKKTNAKLKLERNSAYMRSYRARKKVDELKGAKEKGWRGKVSKLYAKIIADNRIVYNLGKRLGIHQKDAKKRVKDSIDPLKGTVTKSYVVWEFENLLRDYLKNETFRYYKFLTVGKKYDMNRNKITSVLMTWFDEMNMAYATGRSTPRVNTVENYAKKGSESLTIDAS